MKLLSSLLITFFTFNYYSQSSCFTSKDDVMTYVIGKSFESKDGQISIKFNTSQATLNAGSSSFNYMYDKFSYLGSGYKGVIEMTELSGEGGLKMYVSCKERMMTDNKGTLLYEGGSGDNISLSGSSNVNPSVTNNKVVNKTLWMAENLNVDKFRNGDAIPEAKTSEEWIKAAENKQPAWCYYNNDPANGKIYGKLYNWYTVNDLRGLAPIGWHIPSIDEWHTNKNQFPDLHGGQRYSDGKFYKEAEMGFYWLSTEVDNSHANSADTDSYGHLNGNYDWKEKGFSIRCLKD